MKRLAFHILLLFGAFAAIAEAKDVKITLRNSKGLSSPLRAVDTSGVIYISVNDLASLLQLQTLPFESARKLEVTLTSHRFKLTADNPFAAVTEMKTGALTVFQLTLPVFARGSEFFIAAEGFVRLFNRLESLGAEYDPLSRTLTFGYVPESPYDITGLQFAEFENGFLITVRAARRLGDYDAILQKDGWVYVTVANATADTLAIAQTKPEGPIREIIPIVAKTAFQLTFRVDRSVERVSVSRDPGSHNLLVSLFRKSQSRSEATPASPPEPRIQRDRWKIDVIVIDPGHGGKDPGTIGTVGTLEKDITLAVAKRLGNLIEKNLQGVSVVYTRADDTFIELYRRTQLANESNGKLFISIHCNSTPRKPSGVRGFEIYLLRPGKTEEAIAVAEQENGVIRLEENYAERYKNLTDESFIIASLAQTAFVRHSERFAEIASQTMDKHLDIKNNGVKQAGFYVLVGASMPNVLVELGYLSNRTEERFLRTPVGQQKIADALLKAIVDYKEEYERGISEPASSMN